MSHREMRDGKNRTGGAARAAAARAPAGARAGAGSPEYTDLLDIGLPPVLCESLPDGEAFCRLLSCRLRRLLKAQAAEDRSRSAQDLIRLCQTGIYTFQARGDAAAVQEIIDFYCDCAEVVTKATGREEDVDLFQVPRAEVFQIRAIAKKVPSLVAAMASSSWESAAGALTGYAPRRARVRSTPFDPHVLRGYEKIVMKSAAIFGELSTDHLQHEADETILRNLGELHAAFGK